MHLVKYLEKGNFVSVAKGKSPIKLDSENSSTLLPAKRRHFTGTFSLINIAQVDEYWPLNTDF